MHKGNRKIRNLVWLHQPTKGDTTLQEARWHVIRSDWAFKSNRRRHFQGPIRSGRQRLLLGFDTTVQVKAQLPIISNTMNEEIRYTQTVRWTICTEEGK